MSTPENPDPNLPPGGYPPPGYQPPPPGYQPPPAYQPPPGAAYPPPPGEAYQPPSGADFPPPSGDPFQPPSPGGAFPPPGYPPAGFPPPPAVPAKKSRKRLIIGIVGVVVIAIVAIAVVVQNKTATTSASVGSCIKITSATITNPDTSQEDCSSTAAIFVVTETGGSDISCDPNEVSYVEGKDTNDPSSRVCLRYNLKVGECLDPGDGISSVPKKVACSATSTNTVVKLVSLITDSADESKCPSGSTGLALAKRNIVYCLTAAS